jgi:hypothetical protein
MFIKSACFDLKRLFTYLLLILTFHHFHVWAEEVDVDHLNEERSLNPQILFVSLGSSCTVALQLRHWGLRKAAFPFDWLLTVDGDRFVELIERNFQDFLNETYLIKHPHHRAKNFLVHSYYHIEFRHDWSHGFWNPDKYPKALEQLKSKYTRRIERFRALNDFPGKVFFIRIACAGAFAPKTYWPNAKALKIDHASALALQSALKKRFPQLDFTLVIINHNGDEEEMEIVDDIFFFNLSKSDATAANRFRKIFETLQSHVTGFSSMEMDENDELGNEELLF